MDLAEGIYEALPGLRWIRVLVLQPAMIVSDPLVAKFELQDLGPTLPTMPYSDSYHKNHPIQSKRLDDYQALIDSCRLSYTALSYSWAMEDGQMHFNRDIELDGRKRCITQNLAEGLCEMRSVAGSLRFWVDALCIDQSNTAELNAQVAMMFDVYALAQRVDIWLGNGVLGDADYAIWYMAHYIEVNDLQGRRVIATDRNPFLACLDLFMRIDDEACCTPQRCAFPHVDTPQDCSAKRRDTPSPRLGHHSRDDLLEWVDAEASRTTHLQKMLSMKTRLVTCRYWSRRWVVQENYASAMTGGSRILYWAGYSADASTMATLFDLLDSIESALVRTRHHIPVAYDQAPAASSLLHCDVEELRLCSLLHLYSNTQCFDPRDRLYSLVALALNINLEVNYNLSFSEVCLDFAKKLVKTGDFRMLIAAGHPRLEPLISCPSWVPDVREPLLKNGGFQWEPYRMRATVTDDDVLVLETHRLGKIVDAHIVDGDKQIIAIEPDALELTNRSNRLGRLNIEFGVIALPGVWSEASEEDALFCLCEGEATRWYGSVLWLRPVSLELSTYRLMAATDICDFYEEVLQRKDHAVRQGSAVAIRLV
ncbi:hypothetical protein B0A48_14625 [Cryoendolithus antarcticus]|uniref:Heterokaryon incompatibility domain-containing protein n=1 Tax=Cryoendolithus antarcticus TaxID=1507870 RepID=A0A1V8SL18_9PEZI|nr:hypothetical protein B0A48_14625 [Cryoendolithus antarcticus]